MRSSMTLAAALLAMLVGVGTAEAQPSKTARTVQDNLNLFSADAKAKANADIVRIKQLHHKDLLIETTPPPAKPAEIDGKDKAAVDKWIDKWAKTKFDNAQVNGVYVVIVEGEQLKRLRVVLGDKTAEMGVFTRSNRDELVSKITAKLKAGDKNGALLTATSYVLETMDRNGRKTVSAAPTANAPTPQPGAPNPVQPSPIIHWVLIGLAVLAGIWLISALLRGFSSMGSGGAGYGGGGGGFLNGFLGGLVGAAAGMWMYNHFFGSSTPTAFGGDPSGGSEPTDVGGGASVGGADYGDAGADAGSDAGGGGDWGDAGGGDWGGGGGGDWGGGGGGDW